MKKDYEVGDRVMLSADCIIGKRYYRESSGGQGSLRDGFCSFRDEKIFDADEEVVTISKKYDRRNDFFILSNGYYYSVANIEPYCSNLD